MFTYWINYQQGGRAAGVSHLEYLVTFTEHGLCVSDNTKNRQLGGDRCLEAECPLNVRDRALLSTSRPNRGGQLYHWPAGCLEFAIDVGSPIRVSHIGTLAQFPRHGTVLLRTLLGASAAVTYQRNNLWSGAIALWQDAASKSLSKMRTHNMLGMSLLG
jgi:hypothetical protein